MKITQAEQMGLCKFCHPEWCNNRLNSLNYRKIKTGMCELTEEEARIKINEHNIKRNQKWHR